MMDGGVPLKKDGYRDRKGKGKNNVKTTYYMKRRSSGLVKGFTHVWDNRKGLFCQTLGAWAYINHIPLYILSHMLHVWNIYQHVP